MKDYVENCVSNFTKQLNARMTFFVCVLKKTTTMIEPSSDQILTQKNPNLDEHTV